MEGNNKSQRKNSDFLLKHGYNLLMLGILCGLYGMCFALPFAWFWVIYLIVPMSVCLMHRYHAMVGAGIAGVFLLCSILFNYSNLYLFFVLPSVAGMYGLYFALKMRSYQIGVLTAAASVLCGILISVLLAMAVAKTTDFPAVVGREILASHNDIAITTQAQNYYNALYPTEEARNAAGLPNGVTVPDGVDPLVYKQLYAYADLVVRNLHERLVYYIAGYSALVGGAAYLIARMLVKWLVVPAYFYRPRFPVLKEIEGGGLEDMTIPKGYLISAGIPVLILFLLAGASPILGAAYLAAFRALIIVPFCLSAICFLVYLANLATGVWRTVVFSAIILIALLSILQGSIITLLAALGFADYLLNTRVIIKKLFD